MRKWKLGMIKKIRLYPDQEEHIRNVGIACRSHKNILMQASTGWGKTVGAAYMMTRAAMNGQGSFFVVPRIQLLDQTAESLAAYGIKFGYIAARMPPNPFANIQLCTSGTLSRRLDKLPFIPRWVFIDECHYGGEEIDKIVKHFKSLGCWIIGLSATPLKQNGRHMSDWFDHMVVGPQIRQLIDMGRLSDYRLMAPSAPDLSAIKVVNGDYSRDQLSSFMEGNRQLIGDMVSHYKSQAMGKLNVAFAVSIKNTEEIAEAFRDGGVPALAVHSKLEKDEIKRRIKAFARREILCLVNRDLCTFGFDLSAAAGMDVTVESMSDGAPTLSLTKQLQKWGRVLRYKDYPAIILDHAGNSVMPDGTMKHGYPDDDRHWTLEREEVGKRQGGEKAVPVRVCGGCFRAHRPSPKCPFCGYCYPVADRSIETVEGELIEVTRDEVRQIAKEERRNQGRAQTYEELLELEARAGRKAGWADHVYMARNKAVNRQQLRARRARWRAMSAA